MSEIDLTLALQLQAQFEEEARVAILQQEADRQKAEEELGSWQTGTQSSSSSGGGEGGGKQGGRGGGFRGGASGVRGGGNSGRGRGGGGSFGEVDEPLQEKLSVSLIDHSWEMIDPNPELRSLFITFNQQFFWGRLLGVEVKWSPRMTLCAGVCSYEGRGGLCSVRLSVPLLKLRPRKDLIETLLHEMIHAYLFVTANNRDRDGHGPEFHKHMYRINNIAGTHISVYHSFHDEVDVYRQHVWRCDGPCRSRRPYYGLVKRAMNRVPGPRDPWWPRHQQSCGGSYTKIQEPEGYGAKKSKAGKKLDSTGDIRKYIEVKGKSNSLGGMNGTSPKVIDIAGGSRRKMINNGIIEKSKSNDAFDTAGESSLNTVSTGNAVIGKNQSKDTDGGRKNSERDGRLNGEYKPFGSRGKIDGEKKDNIHGFSNTATGSMKRVDVNNTSKSNVHGFGRGGASPAKKKPNRGTGESGPGRGSGQGMFGGRGGRVGGTIGRGGVMPGRGVDSVGRGGERGSGTSGGRGNRFGGRGGGGGGLATRGRGGSSTVTVRGRGTTKTETTEAVTPLNERNPAPETLFQGSGKTLGGGRRGVSRLLSLATSAPRITPAPHPTTSSHPTSANSSSSQPHFNSETLSQNYPIFQRSRSSSPEPEENGPRADENGFSKCPLCDRAFPVSEMNQHLDDCMGMFDGEMSENEPMDTQNHKQGEDDDDPMDDDCLVVGAPSGSSKSRSGNTSKVGTKREREDSPINEGVNNDIFYNSIGNSGEREVSGEVRSNNDSIVIENEREPEVYPCPVCGEKYSQTAMNPHLDSHF